MTHRTPRWLLLATLALAPACGDDDSSTDVGTEDAGAEDARETPLDADADTPTDVPTDVPADVPADTPADVPADTPTDTGACEALPGAPLLPARCTRCHTLDRVHTADYDRAGWTLVVDRMIGAGAVLDAAEREDLIDYLECSH
jgi:hypothetical protein